MFILNLTDSCKTMPPANSVTGDKGLCMDINDIRRINLLALLKGRTKRSCAEIWGTSPSYISQVLSEKTPRQLGDEMARRIELAELLPRGWFDQIHGDGGNLASSDGRASGELNNVLDFPISSSGENELRVLGEISPWGSDTPLEGDDVAVPLYKEVELAAGDGNCDVPEITGRVIRLSRSTLRAAGVEPENAIAAQVSGYSMARLILDGATIGIDIGTKEVFDGSIYALRHDGLLRVKYLYRIPGGGLRLRSENSEEYPDEFYSVDEVAESITVIGFVFWWSTIRPVRRRNEPL